MTLKRLLPLLRGLLGLSDPAPEQVKVPEPSKSRLYQTSKKVLFLSGKGQKLTARVVCMNGLEGVVLRRSGHPRSRTFVRPATEVFLR